MTGFEDDGRTVLLTPIDRPKRSGRGRKMFSDGPMRVMSLEGFEVVHGKTKVLPDESGVEEGTA